MTGSRYECWSENVSFWRIWKRGERTKQSKTHLNVANVKWYSEKNVVSTETELDEMINQITEINVERVNIW